MNDVVVSSRRIGILGGFSDQATADYYSRINRAVNARAGGWNTAEILISSMNFGFSADCVQNDKWEEVGAYLADRAELRLGNGGDDRCGTDPRGC